MSTATVKQNLLVRQIEAAAVARTKGDTPLLPQPSGGGGAAAGGTVSGKKTPPPVPMRKPTPPVLPPPLSAAASTTPAPVPTGTPPPVPPKRRPGAAAAATAATAATTADLAEQMVSRRKSLIDLNRQFSSLFGSALVQGSQLPTPPMPPAKSPSLLNLHMLTPPLSQAPSLQDLPLASPRARMAVGSVPSPLGNEKVVQLKRQSTVFTLAAEAELPFALLRTINQAEELDIVKEVGVGAFGTVSLVRHASVKTDLALKVLERNHSPVVQEQYDNEKLFASFSEVGKSPQLIRLLASWETDDHFYLLMDFCPGGDLYQLVNDYHISEENATWIIAQAASAIETVHSLDFAHRDIKPDNFLVDARGLIKLCDFGFSIPLSEGKVICMRSVGTPQYIAPEVLSAIQKDEPYTFACDWWSFGIVIYELVLAFTPFDHSSVLQTHAMIREHAHYFRWPEEPAVSTEFKDLVQSLVVTMDKRIDIDSIREHPFLKHVDWVAIKQGKSKGIHLDLQLTRRTEPKPNPPPAPPPPKRAPPARPPSFLFRSPPPMANF